MLIGVDVKSFKIEGAILIMVFDAFLFFYYRHFFFFVIFKISSN